MHSRRALLQLEVDVMYDRLVSHAPEGLRSGMSKFRILSVDIECAGRKASSQTTLCLAPSR
jgi:DNA polymerase delta subunit 1